MATLGRAVRRGLVSVALVAVSALVFAAPAAAHAELVSSNPGNGERLEEAPSEIELTFTESVNLLEGAIRLLDGVGETVSTPDPVVSGLTLTWPMPPELADGAYTVSWRVISSDGHPVAGAFSFGVGIDAALVSPVGSTDGVSATTAPWPVVTARLTGYLAFALLAGVVAFVLCCSAGSRTDPTLQRLVRWGLVGGVLATTAGFLLQGPYIAGSPLSDVFDPQLMRRTLATPFGTAMVWRIVLYAAIAGVVWRLPGLSRRPGQALASGAVVGVAVTIGATGHGVASGRLADLAVVALHALTAAIWLGGLVVLVALGRAVERQALHRFASLAFASVAILVVTGTLNSLRHVTAVGQLWQTRYGLELVAKLALVAAALAAAAVSRRRLQEQRVPVRSVRVEAVLTVGVLTVTAFLSMTSPPPLTADATTVAPSVAQEEGSAVLQMSLGDGGRAMLGVQPATTAESRLYLLLTDAGGQALPATRVDLSVSNPSRGLGGIPVPLTERKGAWVTKYRFPYSGLWKVTLTVTGPGQTAVVTAGDFTIRDPAATSN